MTARIEDAVEFRYVDGIELFGRGELRLRGLVILETPGGIGLRIRLVGLGIERRLTARRTGERDLVACVLEDIIGCGKFLEPEAGFLARVSQLVVAGQNHQDFHSLGSFSSAWGMGCISASCLTNP